VSLLEDPRLAPHLTVALPALPDGPLG